MKFVYVTDLHLRSRAPARRTDEWPEACLVKLRAVVQAAKNVGADFVLCGGDLFDGPRPALPLLAKVAEIISKGPAWACVPGNHDVVGRNASTWRGAGLGVLSQLGNFAVIEEGAPFQPLGPNVEIHGFPYVDGIDRRISYSCRSDFAKKSIGGRSLVVAVPHAMILHDDLAGSAPFDHVAISDVETDADLVLCSHYHPGWPTVVGPSGATFAHPGALVRLSAAEAHRLPLVFVIYATTAGDSGREWSIDEYAIAAPASAFDLEGYERDRAWGVGVDRFVDAVGSVEFAAVGDLSARVREAAKRTGAPRDVLELALERIGGAA